MKVLDLHCSLDHRFEGWFASEDDFQRQLARALVECPVCGDTDVRKALSAPRLNLGASEPARDAAAPAGHAQLHAQSHAAASSTELATAGTRDAMQAAWLRTMREVMARTEDVGERFAEEARRMHYGEAEERNIRGRATREQTAELLDEGIAVLPLPVPPSLKGPLQ